MFFLRIWRIILFLRAAVNIPIQTHNSAMTVIAQDDHLTAGAWTACVYIRYVPQKELSKFLHSFFIYSEDNNRADCRNHYEATCPLEQWLNRLDKSFDKYSSIVGFTSEILKLLNNLNMFFCSLCSTRKHCVLEEINGSTERKLWSSHPCQIKVIVHLEWISVTACITRKTWIEWILKHIKIMGGFHLDEI